MHINSKGRLLVIGVLIKKGDTNKKYAPIWNKLPKNHDEVALVNRKIKIKSPLPENKAVYNYSGSLTTPPCSEGVSWNVMIHKVKMSKYQIREFEEIYENNNRPVLPLNSREVVKGDKDDKLRLVYFNKKMCCAAAF